MTIVALIIFCVLAVFLLRPVVMSSGRRNTLPKSLPDPNRNWPQIVAAAIAEVRQHERPCVALDIIDGPVTEEPHSSIGGQPSLPSETPWPLDEKGKPMIFLAQINYAQMPPLEGYPAQGVISFFVMDDDLNGCRFPSVGADGFQVLFHPDAQTLVRRALPENDWDFSPLSDTLIKEGRPLSGRACIGSLSQNSGEVSAITKDWYPDCPKAIWEEFENQTASEISTPFYYGGHPDFTQQDFRRKGASPDYTPYTEVLLQLGFLSGRKTELEVCWGDAGEACFLATKADLAAKQFDKLAYNWDCG
jgi:uncharacterized protein YwqG